MWCTSCAWSFPQTLWSFPQYQFEISYEFISSEMLMWLCASTWKMSLSNVTNVLVQSWHLRVQSEYTTTMHCVLTV